LNSAVRQYWEAQPCGTDEIVTVDAPAHTKDWYERIEEHRYRLEPYIHAIAQFSRYRGQRVLEIGVGAGTDHLQWARAGACCTGVDLTEAAITLTRERLALYGLESDVRRVDAETLPFGDASFDVVYSWGVIHHSDHPPAIVSEVRRVLGPGGVFIGMVYARHSVVALKVWLKHALLRGRPWRSFADVLSHHMESVGTKAYTPDELRQLLVGFRRVEVVRCLTPYDTKRFTPVISQFFLAAWGWNLGFRAYA